MFKTSQTLFSLPEKLNYREGKANKKMMMMMMQEEFQDRKNLSINDIDLSLLRLSSPVSPPDIFSPLKRSSPVSDGSDPPKRRRLSPSQDPIFITSPLRSPHREPHPSSNIDDSTALYPNLFAGHIRCSYASPTPSASETLETETMKMVNNHEEANYDAYEEINRQETNYDPYEEEEEEEEDCGEGMRIERSGDGFVIRLKCKCKLAYRLLFSDHHLYFKSL